MGLFEELEKEMASEETAKSEGLANSITRAMLGDEVAERSKALAELKRKRQEATDRLSFIVGAIMFACIAAIAIAGTVWVILWMF